MQISSLSPFYKKGKKKRNKKMKKTELDYKTLSITLLILMIINLFISYKMWQLYEPQATIVLHDYGEVFKSTNDWKIWRIEHNK